MGKYDCDEDKWTQEAQEAIINQSKDTIRLQVRPEAACTLRDPGVTEEVAGTAGGGPTTESVVRDTEGITPPPQAKEGVVLCQGSKMGAAFGRVNKLQRMVKTPIY